MKKFLTKILYFLLPVIILAYPLDSIMSHYLSKSITSPGEYEVWNHIYDSESKSDVAIYGSSRAWVHINPNILSDSLGVSAYNFGIDGHNFWLQYLRHLELLKNNKKPKFIILSVDIFSLQKRNDLYQLDQFLPYMLWNSNIHTYTKSYIGYTDYDYYIPLIRYSGKTNSLKSIIKNIIKGQSKTKYRNHGYLGVDSEWNTDLEKAQKELQSYEINTDSLSIELFEQFIEECKESNIELVLVYTPEHIDGQNFVSNRNDIIQIYRDLSTKHSIDFYDYSDDSLCLDKNYFYNASHLNSTGADIFSQKLAQDLKVQLHNKAQGKIFLGN